MCRTLCLIRKCFLQLIFMCIYTFGRISHLQKKKSTNTISFWKLQTYLTGFFLLEPLSQMAIISILWSSVQHFTCIQHKSAVGTEVLQYFLRQLQPPRLVKKDPRVKRFYFIQSWLLHISLIAHHSEVWRWKSAARIKKPSVFKGNNDWAKRWNVITSSVTYFSFGDPLYSSVPRPEKRKRPARSIVSELEKHAGKMNTDHLTSSVIKEASVMVQWRVRIVLMDTREVMISMDFVSELDNVATKKYGNYEKKRREDCPRCE